MKASSSNADAAKDCYLGTAQQISNEVKSLRADSLFRTQDIKIILPKFSIANKGVISDSSGKELTTFLDRLNHFVITNDPHYSKFKFNRQSNFKPSVVNSLSIFENQSVYNRVMAQVDLVGQMYSGVALNLPLGDEEEKKEEETKEATPSQALSQVLFSEQEMASFDYAGTDQQSLAATLVDINAVLQGITNVYMGLTSVVKLDG
jgi:hypothetical protein